VEAFTGRDAVTDALAAAETFGRGQIQFDPIDGISQGPGDLRRFLAELRLLHQIPFSYLVPDADLLPMESIRFFYVDRNWTDAVVQGVLSVGTITTADRAQLEAAYPTLRDEIDETERTIRAGSEPGLLSGPGGTITGFLLRSRAVSGWPNLHVRAYADESLADDELTTVAEDHESRLKILRLERLAPAVLLALIDGVPELIHIEEPRQGIQFGVRYRADSPPEARKAYLPLRDIDDGEDNGLEVDVPFRAGAPGVIDLAELKRRVEDKMDVGQNEVLDPNEFALQVLRFPFRQVFGDPNSGPSRYYDLDDFVVTTSLQEWRNELAGMVERVDGSTRGEEAGHGS
jgi:hypothetical protein